MTSSIYKIAEFIDKFRIAIKINKAESEEINLHIGDTVKVISRIITIHDPDYADKSLGKYTIYKDSLEVTEIEENFIIATKYTHNGSIPLTISIVGKKEKSPIAVPNDVKFSFDNTLKIGDQVEFFG